MLSPAGRGKGTVGLMSGKDREPVQAKADFFITGTNGAESGKISWWWQGTWPFPTRELTVGQYGKGRLFFLYPLLPQCIHQLPDG